MQPCSLGEAAEPASVDIIVILITSRDSLDLSLFRLTFTPSIRWRHWALRQEASELENRKVRHRQDDPDVEVTISDRGTDNPDAPDTGCGCVAGGGLALSHNCARAEETDACDHSLQDACLSYGTRPEDGYRCLHEPAAGHRDQRKGADTGALLLARSIPADRQGEEECNEEVDEVLEAVVPNAKHVRHYGLRSLVTARCESIARSSR
jgi:hypothetical protein